ncbi:MAG TPA: hypothetical protein RMH99_17355, partial [Sandaracinaceae bacterium LLY-WYZ-13_1]|nr:hypothetical protein [Sandaracinaceae bacterium LLY-WYZ-13_1]
LVGDPLEAASGVADSVFETQELSQRRSTRLDIPGFYGREDVGVAPNGAFVALRQFVGRSRVYVAMAVVANARRPLGAAEHFMGSIELDESDAILPFGAPGELEAIYLPEADFTVRMPALTHRRTVDVRVGEHTRSAWVFESRGDDVRYRVRVIAFPEGVPPGSLAEVREGLSLGDGRGPVHASGFGGRAFTRSSDSTRVDARAYVTAHRVYVVEAARRRGDRAHRAEVTEFFSSFRIL